MSIQDSTHVVLIFNPDTDYALVSGSDFYNPPASVIALRKRLASTPLLYSRPGDTLILLDDFSEEEFSTLDADCRKRQVRLLSLRDFYRLQSSSKFNASNSEKAVNSSSDSEATDNSAPIRIFPWGWNHSLRHLLLSSGIPEAVLPSPEYIDTCRQLAHRRTTIAFNRHLLESGSIPGLSEDIIPREITNADEAMDFYRTHPACWFKAPWSSAGRGVLATSGLSETAVRQWISGIIRKQGSVMAETDSPAKYDFATEWWSDGDTASFLGYSRFATDGKGHFKELSDKSQNDISQDLASLLNINPEIVINTIKDAIEEIISPRYRGPLGIDMLVGPGAIRPCIEINLRATMGMAPLEAFSKAVHGDL